MIEVPGAGTLQAIGNLFKKQTWGGRISGRRHVL